MTNKNYRKYPALRDDLKISKMKTSGSIHYVVKDPLKEQYYRFSEEEWLVIDYFRGSKTLEEIMAQFNSDHQDMEIDLESVEGYWNHLDSINILQKSQKEMNVMLVEKMKEMRQSQLLAKKGSLFYKRFPIIDPDKLFDKIIPYIGWIWSLPFFIFSFSIMITAVIIILTHWTEFNQGVYEIFSFSEMSAAHLITLWVVIYGTIALHEVGHGLTCKYYGGEVHEIGFLLLFFQPCLYCNVNDAWLFDKKWKQILVTLAGGYIEFFIGSICAIIWLITSPNTFINVISMQIMTICSLSTVCFNFNPMMKLDGYYLLSDLVEVPNLKDDSLAYLKHTVATKIFRMPGEKFYATKREKRVYLVYGVCSFIYMTLLLTGLVAMAKGILVDSFHEIGILITGFIAYKIFGGHVTKSGSFMLKFFIQKRKFFKSPKFKLAFATAMVGLVITLILPIHFKLYGKCFLNPQATIIMRTIVDGQIEKFFLNDGEMIKSRENLFKIKNETVPINRKMASTEVKKQELMLRKTLVQNKRKYQEVKKELLSKQMTLKERIAEETALIYRSPEISGLNMFSCPDIYQKLGSFINKGDEICSIQKIDAMKTIIEINEAQIRFLRADQKVIFKLSSNPVKSYTGKISEILPTGKNDPKNPQRKIYNAVLEINNPGELRPGMEGVAKVYGIEMSIFKYLIAKLTSTLRLDLFY